jgi:putative glycosyltransferase (TIGR04372 family)
VRIIRSSRARDALVIAFWVATSPLMVLARRLQPVKLRVERLQRTLEKERRARTKRARRRARGVSVWAQTVGEQLTRFASFSLGWTEPARANGKLALRQEMASDPIRLQLLHVLEEQARAQAARLGLQPDARIVTLHVREPGWRPFEDDQRSCDINTYRPAVEELVARGFRVVRIGDASMTPIDWPGVLDLATEPARTDLLELWCVLHSVFFFGSESGPLELARLVGLPALLVNVKTVQSGYPVHRSDLLIMKRLLASDAPRVLSLREQLAVKAGRLTLTGRARYVDNTPEEILAALDEMLQGESSRAPESPAQAEFRRLATSKVVNGAERERYLGAGRVARFFADRYLDHSEPLGATGEHDPVGRRAS